MTEQPRRTRLLGPSDEQEEAAAHRMVHGLDTATRLMDRYEKIAHEPPRSGSQLALDDQCTKPVPMSQLTGYAMSVAIANFRALSQLLQTTEGGLLLPQVAAFPLLRSAMQAGAYVVWLLVSDDRRERVTRLLQARTDEITYDGRLMKRFAETADGDDAAARGASATALSDAARGRRRQRKMLDEIAASLSIAPSSYDDGRPSWIDLLDEAARYAFTGRAHTPGTTWMAVSGLTHPSRARAMWFSTPGVDRPPVDDKWDATSTASTTSAMLAVSGTFAFLRAADQLIRHRRWTIENSNDNQSVEPD